MANRAVRSRETTRSDVLDDVTVTGLTVRFRGPKLTSEQVSELLEWLDLEPHVKEATVSSGIRFVVLVTEPLSIGAMRTFVERMTAHIDKIRTKADAA